MKLSTKLNACVFLVAVGVFAATQLKNVAQLKTAAKKLSASQKQLAIATSHLTKVLADNSDTSVLQKKASAIANEAADLTPTAHQLAIKFIKNTTDH